MPIKDNKLVLDGYTLTIEELVKAGKDMSIKIEIDEKNWPKIRECRKMVDKWANEERCIYGVIRAAADLSTICFPRTGTMISRKTLCAA